MTIEGIAASGVNWLWEEYGKALADKALDEVKKKWTSFRWNDAEAEYRERMRQLHSTTRLLGHPTPISVSDIYTDVYVLDKLTAFQRYDISELRTTALQREAFALEEKRRPALRLAMTTDRLYILGKPGSGKTTFLKYLTLQACAGKIPKTPIFVSLKEWAGSGLTLMAFIVEQFRICAFPDAKEFIEHLLKTGKAIVLFDGLDEVNQEGELRQNTIDSLTKLSTEYPKAQIFISCRIAATDYSFTQFTYLEIADFDENQMRLFASKWYQRDRTKLSSFLAEFEKPEHRGLREISRTPLLLALLCLTFDEVLTLPVRRVDLYKEAFDALLKKWDTSRGIRRDEIYRGLSVVRKEQMLARIAAQNFEAGEYFIRTATLGQQFASYLKELPVADTGDVGAIDGEAVLRAVESQHGVLVERAYGIYSFSHLTFQEYLTARYIVENAANDTIGQLIRSHLTDDR